MRRLLASLLASSVVACAGSNGSTSTTPDEENDVAVVVDDEPDEPAPTLAAFDPKAFIAAYAGARSTVLAPIPADHADLDRRLREERDPVAKRALARASVIAHLEDALAAQDPAAVVNERRAMDRSLRIARRGNRDARMLAELAFASAYLAFQIDAPDRVRLADEFFMRHVVDRELLRIVTMIRGELAFARGDASRARAIFALLVGDTADPLHAYGLYRTAATHCTSHEDAACRETLERTRLNGCAPNAPAEAQELGERAYQDLGAVPVARRDRDRQAPRYCTRADTATFADPLFGP